MNKGNMIFENYLREIGILKKIHITSKEVTNDYL